MINLQNTQLIHIVSELVCIVIIIVYINVKNKKLNTKIQILEYEVKTANTKISILHNMIEDILQLFNPKIRNTFKEKYNIQRPPVSKNQINNTDMKNTLISQQQSPPKRKQVNPLESIMSMVGPMMSSMMVSGGYDNQESSKVEKPVIIEEDNDIENELNELEKLEVKSKVKDVSIVNEVDKNTTNGSPEVDKNTTNGTPEVDKNTTNGSPETSNIEPSKSPMIQEVKEEE